MTTPKFETIDEQYVFGYRANRKDGSKVEVVRAYENQWLVFTYTNGGTKPDHKPHDPGKPEYLTYQQAMSEARAYLRG